MKVKDLKINAFGHFTDRVYEDLPANVVLIHGSNEAGKSTLFSLLKSMLYGFYPVRDFPYRPWDVDRYPEFEAIIELEDGREATVQRKLTKTAASGTLELDGDVQDLSNHDLPFVSHVSKDLYGSLYALTQENKRELKQGTRREVEDRLLGGLGTDIIRPAREAIKELESRSTDLWRPDNRGKPTDKQLRKQLREARSARKEAKENDEALRETARKLSQLEREIEDLEEELAETNAMIKRGEKLVPLKQKLEQIEGWRQEVPDIAAVRTLPDGLEAEYRRLADKVEDARAGLEELDAEKHELQEKCEEYTDEHRHILSYENQIQSWARRISGHEKEREEISKVKRRVEKKQQDLQRLSKGVLATDWDPSLEDALDCIVLPDLKSRIQDYEENQQAARDLQAEMRKVPDAFPLSTLPLWLILGIAGAGIALTLAGILLSASAITGGGIGMMVLGIAGYGLNWYINRQKQAAETERQEKTQQLEEEIEQAEARRDTARQRTAEILADLPVADSLLEKPDTDLYRTIEGMQRTLGELQDLRDDAEARLDKWEEAQKDLSKLVAEFDEDPSEAGIRRLEEQLSNAQELRSQEREAKARIRKIDQEERPARDKALNEAKRELSHLTEKIREAVPDDIPTEEALDRATELQKTVRRIADAEEQLEEKHPDLEGLKDEIRDLEKENEEIELSQEEFERAKIRRDNLNEEIQDLREKKGNLQTEIKNARDQTSVGELEGKIEQLKEEQSRVRTERDRLVLLANILRKADRNFRDKHQPDVLQGASEYFLRIAEGYRGLTTVTDDEGGERLAVRDEAGGYRKVQPPLSGGTRDQVYLSFRLAVVDHLDENQESLPLLLDETLINWDDDRLIKGGQILSEAARNRQIIFFTCHRWITDRLAEAVGTEALEL